MLNIWLPVGSTDMQLLGEWLIDANCVVGWICSSHACMHAWTDILLPRVHLSFRRRKVYKAFHWTPEYGGQAYNYTLKSLRNKLHNLWGVHYRSRSRSLSRE